MESSHARRVRYFFRLINCSLLRHFIMQFPSLPFPSNLPCAIWSYPIITPSAHFFFSTSLLSPLLFPYSPFPVPYFSFSLIYSSYTSLSPLILLHPYFPSPPILPTPFPYSRPITSFPLISSISLPLIHHPNPSSTPLSSLLHVHPYTSPASPTSLIPSYSPFLILLSPIIRPLTTLPHPSHTSLREKIRRTDGRTSDRN